MPDSGPPLVPGSPAKESKLPRRASVTVLSEECDDGGGGREVGVVGEVGEVTSLSGLAIRRPPSDCESERSPALMLRSAEAAPALLCASQWNRSASALQVGAVTEEGSERGSAWLTPNGAGRRSYG